MKNLQNKKYILASKSPRRQYLLKELGLPFEVKTKEIDESFPGNLKAQEIALYLCEKKANAFGEELSSPLPKSQGLLQVDRGENIIITADTIVWIGNQALNKPADHKDAVRMLRLLSGAMHEVFTGVCLRSKNKTRIFYAATKVYFKKLAEKEINHYIASYKPFDKAGSYGAQECLPAGMNPCSTEEKEFLKRLNKTQLIENSIVKASAETGHIEIEKIEGSYFNVMGLPLKELYEELILF